MARTQYLSYKLLDMPLLSPTERALLQIIQIRPEYCLENLATLGHSINRSARTVQRTIETLVQKGLIIKKYTTFKRIILKIVSIKDQEKIASGGLISQVFKFCKFSKFKRKKSNASYDTTSVSGIDTTSVSGSIKRSKEIKSIIEPSLKTFDFRKKDLTKERNRQVQAYMDYLKRQS